MSDNTATMQGYTKEVHMFTEGNGPEFFLLVKPGTDLDSRFKAWDTDDQDWIVINGWMFYTD